MDRGRNGPSPQARKIARRKAIEKEQARRATALVLKDIPRCPHGSFTRICPKCSVKDTPIPF
jgi:hypothetical protein